MYDKLYQEYIKYIISLTPNVSTKVKRYGPGKLIEGPIIFKT